MEMELILKTKIKPFTKVVSTRAKNMARAK
jgi:hypothetical protein